MLSLPNEGPGAINKPITQRIHQFDCMKLSGCNNIVLYVCPWVAMTLDGPLTVPAPSFHWKCPIATWRTHCLNAVRNMEGHMNCEGAGADA